MASRNKGYRAMGAMALRARRGLRMAALTALAVGALAAATMALQGGPNHAAAQMASGLRSLETCGVSDGPGAWPGNPGLWPMGAHEMSATWPAIPPYSGDTRSPTAERPHREVYVWATLMMVGMATDGATTFTGYMPDADMGTEGSLGHTSFNYDGVDYNVRAIFHQQALSGMQQVVFKADRPLPQHLVFYAGDDRFAVSDSLVMESGQNIHVWRVDESPGWEEGQRIPVALLERAGSICE